MTGPPTFRARLVDRLARFTGLSEADRFELELFLHFIGVGASITLAVVTSYTSGSTFQALSYKPAQQGVLVTAIILLLDGVLFWPLTRWVREKNRHDLTPWITCSWIVLTQIHTGYCAHLYGTTQSVFLVMLPGGALVTTAALGARRGLFNMIVAFAVAAGILALEKSGAIPFAPLSPELDESYYLTNWFIIVAFVNVVLFGTVTWGTFALFATLLEENQRQLREAQERALRAESLAAMGALVDGAAHEIRNPLASATSLVRTVLDDLKMRKDLPPDFTEDTLRALGTADRSHERIEQLVEPLLALSNAKGVKPSPVHLSEAAARAVRRIEESGNPLGSRLSQAIPGNLPPFLAQPQLTEFAIYHLLRNAEQATRAARGAVRLAAHKENGRVVLVCEDEGAGLPAGLEASVFDPFVGGRGDWEGVGLGLYVVQEAARAFGGRAMVESPRRPTRFRMEWPAQSTKTA